MDSLQSFLPYIISGAAVATAAYFFVNKKRTFEPDILLVWVLYI